MCFTCALRGATATKQNKTVVVSAFGEAYPELREKEAFVMEIVKDEEEAFSSMLVLLITGIVCTTSRHKQPSGSNNKHTNVESG